MLQSAAMDDVVVGYVYDFGSGEEWTATKGGGAWLNGERLGDIRPKDEIEILALEATVAAGRQNTLAVTLSKEMVKASSSPASR